MNDRITDVPPPGFFIREELEAREWTQRDLAYVLGVQEQAVNMIISGKRGISADMAKALGDAFDVPAEFFTNLQKTFDLSQAREPDPGVARKAKLQSTYPIREMIKRGWLTDASASLLETQIARFFDVKSHEQIPYFPHAAKKTDYENCTPAQIAWLFRVRQIAREILVPPYSEKSLRESLLQLRQFMIDPEETRYIPRVLSECGVKLVIVEALPGSQIDGVCLWLGKTPVIGLSLLRDRIDNFWFVLRHEIEHVLHRHGKDEPIIDDDLERDKVGLSASRVAEEEIANSAAREFCVPVAQMDDFIKRKNPFFSEREVLGFAKRLQIHPGIVAGQLRKRIDRWNIFSRMLVKVRPNVISGAMVDGWGHTFPVSV